MLYGLAELYWSTPMPWCGLIPAELCMEGRARTQVPQVAEELIPTWSFLPEFCKKNEDFKGKTMPETLSFIFYFTIKFRHAHN